MKVVFNYVTKILWQWSMNWVFIIKLISTCYFCSLFLSYLPFPISKQTITQVVYLCTNHSLVIHWQPCMMFPLFVTETEKMLNSAVKYWSYWWERLSRWSFSLIHWNYYCVCFSWNHSVPHWNDKAKKQKCSWKTCVWIKSTLETQKDYSETQSPFSNHNCDSL